MFPYSQNPPVVPREDSCDSFIALFVAAQFLLPEGGIIGRHVPALGATVPEAAVNENGNACRPKGEVWTTRKRKVPAPTWYVILSKERCKQ